MHWITFAPITSEAATFYATTPLQIGLLSMSFMIVYILMCVPASYMIDTYGLPIGVGIGAALTGAFGLLKGVYGSNYTIVCISQFGLAVAQPFILNAVTKVGAHWFPIHERATSAGLSVLAQFIGIVIAMVATPYLTIKYTIPGMLMFYGVISLVSAIVFLALMRDRPPTPPCPPGQDERVLVLEGLKHIFKQRDMQLVLVVFFIGLGMFNAVTTWIEQILSPRGFDATQAGMVGGLMMIGGIVGAIIVPLLSDKYRRRVPFIMVAMVCTAPGLIGLTFATSYWLLLVSSFVLGFFFMSAGPIGFQYGAEVSYPAPEATSQGMLMLSGQISGILFILGMDKFRSLETGSMTPSLIVLIGLTLVNILLCTRLRESSLIQPGQK
jgi:sugar phosphate permease